MDRRIEYPDNDVPLLTWWDGIYDHVFIALHPFFRIRKSDKEPGSSAAEYEPVAFPNSLPEGIDWDAIKLRGEPRSWKSVHMAVSSDVPDRQFQRAVWLLSCLGVTDHADRQLQEKIVEYCCKEQLFCPEDDVVADCLSEPINRFLKQLGGNSVRVWDEFRHNAFDYPVSAFATDQPALFLPTADTRHSPYAIDLEDPGVLITAGFDDSYSFIAMTQRAISHARPEDFFEGHYADEHTYCDWLNPKSAFRRAQ
ncbi:MAG: hypothetical protein AB7O39_00830 [Flavobacteriaceae bacterium]